MGLENLGGFENHNHYSGLFLGYQHSNWHLEFTTSLEKPKSTFDEDDILVFYVNTAVELNAIKKVLKQKNIPIEVPKNPYWAANGIMISDPDNYKIVFSIKYLIFNLSHQLATLVKSKGIENWSDLIDYIKKLPYGIIKIGKIFH